MSAPSVDQKIEEFPSSQLLNDWDIQIMAIREQVEAIRVIFIGYVHGGQLDEKNIESYLASLSMHINDLSDRYKLMVVELEKIKTNTTLKRVDKMISVVFTVVFLINGLAGFSEALGKKDDHSELAIALIVINLISVVAMGMHAGIIGKKRFNKKLRHQFDKDLNEREAIVNKYKNILSYYELLFNVLRPSRAGKMKETVAQFLSTQKTFIDERLSASGASPRWTVNVDPGLLVSDSSDSSHMEPATPMRVATPLQNNRFRNVVNGVIQVDHILHLFRPVYSQEGSFHSRSSTGSSGNSVTAPSTQTSNGLSDCRITVELSEANGSMQHALSVASLEAYCHEEDDGGSSTPL